MSARQMFLDWANKLAPWLSDALRRLCQVSSLSEADREQILLIGLAQHGLLAQDEQAPQPTPLSEEHLSAALASEETFVIHRLRDVTNVNALAPDQDLEFAKIGMTTIFGENGSGKSGYARLFKNACRSRHSEEILGNMHSDEMGPASAHFEVSRATDFADVQSEPWSPDGPMPAMSTLAMYDGRCGRALLDEENDIAFSSELLDAASAFAELWNWLTQEIDRRITVARAVSPPLAALSQSATAVGRAVALGLKNGLDIAALKPLRGLSEEEEAALAGAKEALAHLASQDHQKAAKTERLHAATHAERFEQLTTIASRLGGESAAELTAAVHLSRKTTEAATELVANLAFADCPLPGVGSDPWRRLYAAARAFCSDHAYTGRDFPQIEDGDRCPYCMQELDDGARDRLRRFDELMTTTAQGVAKEAESAMHAQLATLSSLPARASFDRWLKELAIRDEELANELGIWLGRAEKAQLAFENAAKNAKADVPASIPAPPGKEAVERIIADHTSKADAAAKLHDPEALKKRREQLTKIIDSSSSRQQLAVLWQDVEALNAGLLLAGKLQKMAQSIGKGAISTFARKLAAESLTKPVQDCFIKELDLLEYTGTRPRLASKGRGGSAKQVLKFPTKQNPKRISDVLSEGEQRVISLALFLAEVQQAPGNPGVILDDPVSSLDDKWLGKIARRLAILAKERQVIVFTHSIAFLLAIEQSRKKLQVVGTEHTLTRNGQVAGLVTANRVWGAMGLKQRIGWLSDQQQNAAALYKHAPASDEYLALASLITDRARSAWERLIEEGLFAETVLRFRANVETNRLKGVVLTDSLFKAVYWGMTELSAATEAHDSAAHGAHSTPTPGDIQNWIDSLNRARTEVNTESKAAKKMRDALLKAPA